MKIKLENKWRLEVIFFVNQINDFTVLCWYIGNKYFDVIICNVEFCLYKEFFETIRGKTVNDGGGCIEPGKINKGGRNSMPLVGRPAIPPPAQAPNIAEDKDGNVLVKDVNGDFIRLR